MKLSPNFSLRELTRSDMATRLNIDNTPTGADIERLRILCAQVLQPVRDHFVRPVRVNSGFRGLTLNKRIGGSQSSQHMTGEAADIEISSIDNLRLAYWIRDNLEYDQLISECYEAGVASSGWVHVSFATERNRMQNLTYQRGKGYSPQLPSLG